MVIIGEPRKTSLKGHDEMFEKSTLARILDHTVTIPEVKIRIRELRNEASFWGGKKFGTMANAKIYTSIRDVKKECRRIFVDVGIIPLPVIYKGR